MAAPNIQISNNPTTQGTNSAGTIIEGTIIPAQVNGNLNVTGTLSIQGVVINPGIAIATVLEQYADETGTADIITAAYPTASPILTDGYRLTLGISTPNTTVTPTFAPTLSGVLQTARGFVKSIHNLPIALDVGDLQGDIDLRYDLPNTRWIVMNPQVAQLAGDTAQPFAASIFSADAYAATPSVLNNQTAIGYTVLSTDNGKVITLNNAAAITITIPAGLAIGFSCMFVQLGAGQVGFTASSTTINSYGGLTHIIGINGAASIISYATNVYNLSGTLG